MLKVSQPITHLKKQPQYIIKNKSIFHDINMLNLSLNELKLVTKSRGIKDFKSMYKERFLSALNESEPIESEKNFDDKRLKKKWKRF